jgi:N-terminal region of Chorein or VPS13
VGSVTHDRSTAYCVASALVCPADQHTISTCRQRLQRRIAVRRSLACLGMASESSFARLYDLLVFRAALTPATTQPCRQRRLASSHTLQQPHRAECVHAGVTLEDLRIRQDVLSALVLPLELREGSIARLHISGDWTYAKGLRPRIEVSGVSVLAAFASSPRALARAAAPPPPPPPPQPEAQGDGSDGSGAGASGAAAPEKRTPPSLSAAALRQLLKRICVEIKDVGITVVDSTADAGAGTRHASPRAALQHVPRVVRSTSFGARITHITTEGPDQPVAARGLGGDAFARGLDIEFGGAFWVPEQVGVAQAVPPAVLRVEEDTREWRVVQPLTCKVRERACADVHMRSL